MLYRCIYYTIFYNILYVTHVLCVIEILSDDYILIIYLCVNKYIYSFNSQETMIARKKKLKTNR